MAKISIQITLPINSSASLKVAEDVYNSQWLNGNQTYRKHILVIMARSQKRLSLSGFNFLVANMETFDWVWTKICGYFTNDVQYTLSEINFFDGHHL